VKIKSKNCTNYSSGVGQSPPQESAGLGLLDLRNLAGIDVRDNKLDWANEEVGKIIKTLEGKGLLEEQALKGLLPFTRMAKKLSANFGGKILLYLRRYGDMMVREALEPLPLQGISEDQAHLIFTAWLQKISNIPVLLPTPEIKEFCGKHKLSSAELIQTADNINMKVAIVDERLTLCTTD